MVERHLGTIVPTLTFRGVTTADIDQLAASVADAFVAYRSFAPEDWRPPSARAQAESLARWIADRDFWGEVSFHGATLVGHATFIPAARHTFRPEPDASCAHLGHLFVTPHYWGSGAAKLLVAHACEAASARGFTSMRLFVPEGQRRARHFYEREGFSPVGEAFAFGLGLATLEYRRRLP
ncbi:MAG TPA: GNAT family N-acetyltransferase [Solirubrobacteraceae bacterium]|nr:GNAT family N-acetyltransferase [Solirubrobacteraceae bacterium]